jgi:hypothetical protein
MLGMVGTLFRSCYDQFSQTAMGVLALRYSGNPLAQKRRGGTPCTNRCPRDVPHISQRAAGSAGSSAKIVGGWPATYPVYQAVVSCRPPSAPHWLLAVAQGMECIYGPDMSGSCLNVPRLSRTIRLLMLLLGIGSVPSVGVDALKRPHSAQHESAGQHERHIASTATIVSGQDQQAWTDRQERSCTHCPASECARVSPCSGSATTAVPPSRAVVADPHGHRVTIDLFRQLAHSAVSTPLTSPPQLIA